MNKLEISLSIFSSVLRKCLNFSHKQITEDLNILAKTSNAVPLPANSSSFMKNFQLHLEEYLRRMFEVTFGARFHSER